MKSMLVIVLCIVLLSACIAPPMATPAIPAIKQLRTTEIPVTLPTEKPMATAAVQADCRVHPFEASQLTAEADIRNAATSSDMTGMAQFTPDADTMTAMAWEATVQPPYVPPYEPSGQSGFCRANIGNTGGGYFLFPSNWEVIEFVPLGGTPDNFISKVLGFSPGTGYLLEDVTTSPKIIFSIIHTKIPLKSAEASIYVSSGIREVLQNKSTQFIGDKVTLVTLSTRDNLTVKRYFLSYPPAGVSEALYVFSVDIPTEEIYQPEYQEQLKAVEAMIKSLVMPTPPPTPSGPG